MIIDSSRSLGPARASRPKATLSGTIQSVPWALRERHGPGACLRSVSRIKQIVIAFLKHDGIFHALWIDQEVCAKLREVCQENEVVSFTYDAKLRILSVP